MKKLFSLFTALTLCIGLGAQMNFISEVKISAEAGGTTNKQRLINDGFTVIDQDLNAHEGGRDIYIGYKTTTDPTKAITGLLIMESGSGVDVRLAQYKTTPITYRGKNYYRCDSYGSDYVDCDLNRKSGGADITLYYTKDGNTDDGGTPFTVLTAVGENKSMTGYLYTRHWIYGTDMYSTAENDVYGNTNEDNGSYKIYLPYQVHTHAYTATFNWADDGHSCSVTTHCACGDGSTGDATITSEIKTPATYRVDGITTYTAKITLNNKEFTDTKDVQDIVMPLDEVKSVVKGMIDDMVANESRADMSALGSDYKAQVDAAATREDVWAIIDAFPAALDAAAALVLAQAKGEAIAAIQALVSGSTDELVISTANKYIAAIEAATVIEDVARLRSEAESLINNLLTEPNALTFGFIGTGNPIETQHRLERLKMTYSADGEQMTVLVNGAEVVYDLNKVGTLSYFHGTPTITLSTTQNPLNASEYVTTFHSGLEAYAIPEGVRAYTAEVNSAQTAVLLTIINGDVLPQGEAVLLYTDVAGAITMNTVVSDATASETNQLRGTDVRDLTPANCMALNSEAGAFQHYTGQYFPANKAYLLSNAQAPLRIGFSAGQTDTATGMETDSEQIKAQKVLRNGQLFILREGRVFDANGVELR